MEIFREVTWDKIIIPVVAAVITTLVVEYFAKPRLEARKHRLIRDRQQLDEVIFKFQRISLSIFAMLDNEGTPKQKVKVKHNEILLLSASTALYALMTDISRLSHKYMIRHERHMKSTTLFAGFLLSQIELRKESEKIVSTQFLKSVASDLEYFDRYFLTHVGMKDSQERWLKRFFWNSFSKNNNAKQLQKVLKKHKLTKNNK